MKRFFMDARIGLVVLISILASVSISRYFFGLTNARGLVIAAACGGVLGYVLWDPARFLGSLMRAGKETFRRIGVFLAVALAYMSMVATVMIFMGVVVALMAASEGGIGTLGLERIGSLSFWLEFLIFTLSMGLGLSVLTVYGANADKFDTLVKDGEYRREYIRPALVAMNPVAATYWIVRGVILVLVAVAKGLLFHRRSSGQHWLWALISSVFGAITSMLGAFLSFGKRVYRYYHTTQSRICFTYATLFSVLAYWFGSPLELLFVWAITGALVAVLDYELISVRWLKLAPSNFNKGTKS